MTDAPEPTPSDRTPEIARIEQAVRAAFEMGISNVDEIKQLLETTRVEEVRATAMKIADQLSAVFEDFRGQIQVVADRLRQLVDDPMAIAEGHADAQKALLARIAEVAPEASADDLSNLAFAYAQLPPPYSQTFYWPTEVETEDLPRPDSD